MDAPEVGPFQLLADLLPAIFAAAAPGADPPARARLRCVCRLWRGALDAPGAWADLGLHPRAYFGRACAEGRLGAARWLAETFRLPLAAEADLSRPEVARWLVPAAGGPAAFEAPQAKAALRLACGRGDLEHARWLADTFRGGPADPAPTPAVAFTILCGACGGGHLPTARWLAESFGALRGGDRFAATAQRGDWFATAALRAACCGGALEVAQWLAAMASPSLEIGHARQAGFLDAACDGCHWEVARWLMQAFGLTRDDFLEVTGTLQNFCEQGCLAAAQWLDAAVALTAQEVRGHNNSALRAAYRGGHTPVVKWLVETFSLGAQDVTAALDCNPRPAPAAARAKAAAFLATRFVRAGPAAAKGVNPRLLVPDVCAGGGSALAERLLSAAVAAPALLGVPSLLKSACRSGSLKLARRFVAAHPGADLPTDGASRSAALWASLAACLTQSAAMAAWFVGVFDMPAQIPRSHERRSLRAACESGRLPAVQWAVGRMGSAPLPAVDAHAVVEAVVALAEPGRTEILTWLAHNCRRLLIVEGALQHSLHSQPEEGCGTDRIALIRRLVEVAEPATALTAANHLDGEDVEAALGRGDLATAQWLTSTFGLQGRENEPDDA